MPSKLSLQTPKISTNTPRELDATSQAGSVQSTETIKETPKQAPTRFDGQQPKHSNLPNTGERAAVQNPAGGLGWDAADAGPLKLESGKDVKGAQAAVQRVLDGVSQAIAQLQSGADGTPTVAKAAELSAELQTVVRSFADANPLLAPADLGALKQLIGTLSDAVKKADEGQKAVFEASKQRLLGQGWVEVKKEDIKDGWSTDNLAQGLAEKATTGPAFVEYYGKLITAQPGDASTVNERAKQSMLDYNALPENPANGLRFAASTLQRRVEVTEAQFQPPRTNEEITAASIEAGKKNGYAETNLASLIGGALQQVANHQEIEQFSGHLMNMALETIDPKSEPDRGKRVDQALQRAQSWVNNYGRNERDLDAVWYGSLQTHAEALKA